MFPIDIKIEENKFYHVSLCRSLYDTGFKTFNLYIHAVIYIRKYANTQFRLNIPKIPDSYNISALLIICLE